MKLLVTRPEHDVTTRYFSRWAEPVLAMAKEKGIEVIDLHKSKANRAQFEGRVQKLKPDLVFLNGHGSDKEIGGHDNEILVAADDNGQLLDSRITYAVSCQAAKELGSKVTGQGGAFIGYTDDFIFTADDASISRPQDDTRAAPFFESSNHVPISLLKGHTAIEASERSRALFKTHSKRLLSSAADPAALFDAQCLWWNMMHQVCYGDQDARMM